MQAALEGPSAKKGKSGLVSTGGFGWGGVEGKEGEGRLQLYVPVPGAARAAGIAGGWVASGEACD